MEIVIALVITVAAVAAVIYPIVAGHAAGVPLEAEEAGESSPAGIERELADYRAALRAGTLCRRCGRANPEGSRFCAECGRRLAAGRARRARRSAA